MVACRVGSLSLVVFLRGRYLCRFLLSLSLAWVAADSWALGPAACPWYTPPDTTIGGVANRWKFSSGTCSLSSPSCPASWDIPGRAGAPLCSATVSGGGMSCKYTYSNGACGATYYTTACGWGCPAGYTANGSTCQISDINSIPCPAANCPVGSYAGHAVYTGTEGSFYGSECYMGCKVTTGNYQKVGVVDGSVVRYGGDWYRTGEPCSSSSDRWNQPINADMPPPINAEAPPNSPDYFCVTDKYGNAFCTERFKPGCGTVNGKEYCASNFPIDKGECHFIGKAGFVCGGNPTTKANPTMPPTVQRVPPEKTVLISLPGGGVEGVEGPGVWSGDAKALGGMYPGEETLGDDPGGDEKGNPLSFIPGGTNSTTFDKSGLATDANQQTMIGKLGEIKDALAPPTESYGLPGFGEVPTFAGAWEGFTGTLAAGPWGEFSGFSADIEGGDCPTYEIPVAALGTTFTLDAHCTIADQWGGALGAVMGVLWGFLGLRIFFSA